MVRVRKVWLTSYNSTYLMYVSFHSGIRRREHVTSQLDVADDRQSLVRTVSVDANVTLSISTTSSFVSIIIIIMV